MAESPQELLRQMRDQLGLLPQRLAEVFDKQQQAMAQGQMPGQPLQRDAHGRFLPRGTEGQQDNPYRLPTDEFEDIAHRAARLAPSLRPVAQGITKLRETLELIERIEKFVGKLNQKPPEVKKPEVPPGFMAQSQQSSFEAFLRRQFGGLSSGKQAPPAAKVATPKTPAAPEKSTSAQGITTAPAAAPPAPKPATPPSPAVPVAKPVPQLKPPSVPVAQAAPPPTSGDWRKRVSPTPAATPSTPTAPPGTASLAASPPPTPKPPSAVPLFLKPEHLGLTPAQAARKAADAALAASKSPAEVARVQRGAFDYAHENTTNRAAIRQRELLRAMERGLGAPEAMKFAAAQVAKFRAPVLPTAAVVSSLPQSAPVPGRNVVAEMDESVGGKTEAALKEVADALRENTKALEQERKEHGRRPQGAPTGAAPESGMGDIEKAISAASAIHRAVGGGSGGGHSSTLDMVHAAIDVIRIGTMLAK